MPSPPPIRFAMDGPPTTGRRSYETRPASPPSMFAEERGWISNDETPRPTARALGEGGGAGTASRRLAIFGDKLTGQSGNIGRASPIAAPPQPAQLLPPRSISHARPDSALNNRDPTPAPALSQSMASSSTLSPSKALPPSIKGPTRTYDSKLVSREMHRLGNFAHLPSALAPSLSTGPSSSSLSLTSSNVPTPSILSTSSTENPWGTLHVLVLPLFNGEPLRIPIEDLNTLVKRHIASIVSNSPPKAIATLEAEASELIGSGMDTLNGKLAGIEDDKLVGRVVELWGFFWDQVLPYVEGVLLPLQTDPILSSLYRTPKTHRNSSPTRQNGKGSMSMPSHLLPSTAQIDVRTVALRSFRDKIILPIYSRLHARLSSQKQESFSEGHTYPRLQQMLLVLVSQGRRQLTSLSLTEPASQPPAGEAAVTHLLRLVRSTTSGTRIGSTHTNPHQARTLSFLSSNIPRDRRGRIAHRPNPLRTDASEEDEDEDDMDEDEDGAETPRLGFASARERYRGREFLEALRSPDRPGVRQSGGWGLGAFNEDGKEKADEDDEDEQPDWDNLQTDVERMVGMKSTISGGPPLPERRRRMT